MDISNNALNRIAASETAKMIADILNGVKVENTADTPPLPKTYNEINTEVGEAYRQILLDPTPEEPK